MNALATTFANESPNIFSLFYNLSEVLAVCGSQTLKHCRHNIIAKILSLKHCGELIFARLHPTSYTPTAIQYMYNVYIANMSKTVLSHTSFTL